MKKIHITIANILFLLHFLFAVFLIFGWLFPQIKVLYLTILIGWLLSWIILEYCMFTKWEFILRKKYNKNIDTNAEFIKYYMNRFFKKDWSSKAISTVALILFFVFLVLALISQ